MKKRHFILSAAVLIAAVAASGVDRSGCLVSPVKRCWGHYMVDRLPKGGKSRRLDTVIMLENDSITVASPILRYRTTFRNPGSYLKYTDPYGRNIRLDYDLRDRTLTFRESRSFYLGDPPSPKDYSPLYRQPGSPGFLREKIVFQPIDDDSGLKQMEVWQRGG